MDKEREKAAKLLGLTGARAWTSAACSDFEDQARSMPVKDYQEEEEENLSLSNWFFRFIRISIHFI